MNSYFLAGAQVDIGRPFLRSSVDGSAAGSFPGTVAGLTT